MAGDYAYVCDAESGLQVIQVFQRRFDTGSNIAQSLEIDQLATTIDQVKLSATSSGSIGWEISADGGSNWESVAADDSWYELGNPGTDLRWRGTLNYEGGAAGPVCNDLIVEYMLSGDQITFGESMINTIDVTKPSIMYEFVVETGDVGSEANFGFISDEAYQPLDPETFRIVYFPRQPCYKGNDQASDAR